MDVTVVDRWGHHHFWRKAMAEVRNDGRLDIRLNDGLRLMASWPPEDWHTYTVSWRREVVEG